MNMKYKVKTKQGTFEVYSDKESFNEEYSDYAVCDILTALPGTYVRSAQGYYIPVVRRIKRGKDVYTYLPLMYVNLTQYRQSAGGFIWFPLTLGRPEKYRFGLLKTEDKALCNLIAAGYPLSKAHQIVYGTTIKKDYFSNKLLVEYLIELLGMDLKSALKSVDIDDKFIAEQLHQMATNPDVKAQHSRIYAMDTIMKILHEPEQVSAEVKVPQLQGKATFTPLASPNSSASLPLSSSSNVVEEAQYTVVSESSEQ